jgi:hypothetical protein
MKKRQVRIERTKKVTKNINETEKQRNATGDKDGQKKEKQEEKE